jgi:hypothetical protein
VANEIKIYESDSLLGWMSPDKWEQAQNILLEQKIFSEPIMINEAHTMQFLNKIYSK